LLVYTIINGLSLPLIQQYSKSTSNERGSTQSPEWNGSSEVDGVYERDQPDGEEVGDTGCHWSEQSYETL
jgi:hypothetical protein